MPNRATVEPAIGATNDAAQHTVGPAIVTAHLSTNCATIEPAVDAAIFEAIVPADGTAHESEWPAEFATIIPAISAAHGTTPERTKLAAFWSAIKSTIDAKRSTNESTE